MKIKISPFSPEHYPPAIDLWQRCEGICLGESDSKEQIEQFLARNPGLSFVAMKGNTVVGAVLGGHDGRRGYIHHLGVAPEERLQGIGSSLVRHCLTSLKACGILKCHIFVFKNNGAAHLFWKTRSWQYRDDIALVSQFLAEWE